MSILAKLFGSADRLKIVRLFLLNPEEVLAPKDISNRAKIKPASLRKEIKLLSDISFICKRTVKKKIKGWALNNSFPLLLPLKELVLDTTPVSRAELLKKMKRAGQIKLVVLAGIFIRKPNSRVDILIVGDKVRKNILEKVLKEIEAEVGKELGYAVFTTKDFVYRLNIYDKFIRDVLDYPHQKILNKLGV
jgi:predicted nucleotidyltransferase